MYILYIISILILFVTNYNLCVQCNWLIKTRNVVIHLNPLMMWCVCEPLFVFKWPTSTELRFWYSIRLSTYFDQSHYQEIFSTTGVMCMWASVIFTQKFKNEWPTVTAPPVVGGRFRREIDKTTVICGATICCSGIYRVIHHLRWSPLFSPLSVDNQFIQTRINGFFKYLYL